MAIGGTIGLCFLPGIDEKHAPMKGKKRTPGWSYNQTVVSFSKIRPTTSSRVAVVAAGASQGDFFLTSLNISYVGATQAAGFDVMLGTQTISTLNLAEAHTAGMISMNFGLPGLSGGTTTTSTVSLTPIGATITSGVVVATGFRKRA